MRLLLRHYLEKLELANYLEQEFHFDFYDQEIAEFRTLGGVVASVKRHLRALLTPDAPLLLARHERPVTCMSGPMRKR